MDTLVHINSIIVGWEDSFVDFLYSWQTLMGSLVAGGVGWFAASYVAREARHREESSSARIVDLDLMRLAAMGINLNRLMEENHIDSAHSDSYVYEMLKRKGLKVSAIFETSISKISHMDDKLASHLYFVIFIYNEVSFFLERPAPINQEVPILATPEEKSFVKKNFMKLCDHATCAHNLIDAFILGEPKLVRRNRLRKLFRKYCYEYSCVALLDEGKDSDSSNQASNGGSAE